MPPRQIYASCRWVLSPLEWQHWDTDPDDDGVLRVAFRQAGGGGRPSFPLADVELVERPDCVIVTLYERNVGATKLAAITSSVALALQAPLGDRRVHDGIDGARRRRLSAEPAEVGDDWIDRDALDAAPLWEHPRRSA
jgi:hypothetical protein